MTDRRVRFKVDEHGVAQAVNSMLAQGATYEDIAAALAEQHGVDIGKSSIARYNNSLQRKLQRATQVREAARAMTDQWTQLSGDEPDTQMSSALLDMIQATLMERFGEDLKTKDLSFLASAGAKIVTAKTALEKARMTERKRHRAAWDKVTAELKLLLEASGLWPQVEHVLAQHTPTLENETP